MVGFLIATHGGFARGILDSIELIAGKQERIDTISILHETSICCWQVLITRRQ